MRARIINCTNSLLAANKVKQALEAEHPDVEVINAEDDYLDLAEAVRSGLHRFGRLVEDYEGFMEHAGEIHGDTSEGFTALIFAYAEERARCAYIIDTADHIAIGLVVQSALGDAGSNHPNLRFYAWDGRKLCRHLF